MWNSSTLAIGYALRAANLSADLAGSKGEMQPISGKPWPGAVLLILVGSNFVLCDRLTGDAITP
jgi:hypothetical protein